MRRIDLRGAAARQPSTSRSAVPRAEFDVEAAVHVVRPICDDVRARGVEAIVEYSARFDGVEQTDIAVPRRGPAGRAGSASTPPSGPAWRSRSGGCARPARPSSSTTSSPTSAAGARVTHRKVPVERVGLYVPGGIAPLVSSVVMNVVPAQVAGVRVDRARLLAAEGPRRAAAPDDPGRLRAARRRRGLRRRWRPGDRDVRLRRRPVRARSTWSPGRATSTRSPPSGCSRASSASTPRPARPRSRSWPTTPPTPRSSRPT